MKAKPFLFSGIITALLAFFLGYAWYLGLFKTQYDTASYLMIVRPDDETNLLIILLSELVSGFALTGIYGKWSGGKYSISDGLTLGILVGLIPGLGLALMSYATSTILNTTGLILDALYGILAYGLMGAVVAFIHLKMDKSDVKTT